MLYRQGLPENVSQQGRSHTVLEETDQDEIAKATRYDPLTRAALTLIVIGFTTQMLSP